MNKLTKRESLMLQNLITKQIDSSEDRNLNRELGVVYEKIDSLTLKVIEDLNEIELRVLIYDLMRDGAEVQGMKVEEFCLENYNLEW